MLMEPGAIHRLVSITSFQRVPLRHQFPVRLRRGHTGHPGTPKDVTMGLKELFRLPSALRHSVSQSQVTIWIVRISITTFQVIGSFPYTWSGPPYRPKFSLGLCMWAVGNKILQFFGVIFSIVISYVSPDDSDRIQVGVIIANIYMIISFLSLHLTHLAMLFRSPVLAACLDLVVNDPQIMSTESLSCTSLLLTFLVHAVIIVVWGIWYFVYMLPFFSTLMFTVLLVYALIDVVGLLSCCLLFETLSFILSTRLVDVVKEGMVSLLPRGPGLDFSSRFQEVPTMFSLERNIRQMEKLRGDVTSCFFEALTSGLLYCVVYLTGTIYRLLTLSANGGSTAFSILAIVYMLVIMCSVGQNFQNKVTTVVEMLKDRACETTDVEIKADMNRLSHMLEPLRYFSMCGWYTLDKTLILSVISVVMTYLVVMLQVDARMSIFA